MENLTVQKRAPEVIVAEIWTLNRSQLVNWIETGRKLCELKESVPYGEFGKWVKEAGYSTTKANNLMRLYTEFGAAQGNLFGTDVEDFQTYGKLQYSQAVALLDVPAEERAEFMQTHDVEDMSVRELQQAIRERDEAKKDAADREKKLDELNQAFEESQKALEAEYTRTHELSDKIKELEERPVDVAVQVDEEAVRKAAEEAKAAADAAWSKKLDAAKAALVKAEEKAKKAAEKAETAGESAELEAAKAEAEKARAEAEQLRKQLAMSDAAVTTFKIHFAAWQREYQAMMDALSAADEETGGKLRAAIAAQMNAWKDGAA